MLLPQPSSPVSWLSRIPALYHLLRGAWPRSTVLSSKYSPPRHRACHSVMCVLAPGCRQGGPETSSGSAPRVPSPRPGVRYTAGTQNTVMSKLTWTPLQDHETLTRNVRGGRSQSGKRKVCLRKETSPGFGAPASQASRLTALKVLVRRKEEETIPFGLESVMGLELITLSSWWPLLELLERVRNSSKS